MSNNAILSSKKYKQFNISYPVIVKSWEIICDESGNKYVRIKFQKISLDIMAFRIDLICINKFDEKICKYSDYTIKNVNKRGVDFSETIAIDDSTENISLYLKRYVMTDITTGPRNCKNEIVTYEFKRFEDIEDARAANRIIGTSIGFPIDKGSHWYCSCGKINWQDSTRCITCEQNKDTVFQKITAENIEAEKQSYNEKLERYYQKKRKNKITAVSISSALAVLAIIMIALCSTVIAMPSVSIKGMHFEKNDEGGYTLVNFTKYYEDVVIPEKVRGVKVTKIGRSAFHMNRKIKSITIPDSVTEIDQYAFYVCENLTEIKGFGSVTKINKSAFEKCYSLKDVVIPSSVDYIDESAFDGCRKLTLFFQINTPPEEWNLNWSCPKVWNYKSVGGTTDGLKWALTNDDTVTIYGCETPKEKISIPAEINDYPVTAISDNAFYYNYNLTSVNLPENIISIGNNAFESCNYLVDINFPNKLSFIGENAFYHCGKLEYVYIPESVKYIGAKAFLGCNKLIAYCAATEPLENWVFDFDPRSTDTEAIWDCVSHGETSDGYVWKVTNADTVTILKYKGNARILNIPEKISGYPVTCIEDAAFFRCSSIEYIFIPNFIKEIGEYAFYHNNARIYCESPEKPEGWHDSWSYGSKYDVAWNGEEIGITQDGFVWAATKTEGKIFEYHGNSTSLVIPSQINGHVITRIENKAFKDCVDLIEVTFEANNQISSIGDHAFNGCSGLTSISLPKTVTNIGDCAFEGCIELNEFNFGEGCKLENIQNRTFYNCRRLKSITLPDSVNNIGSYAFQDCISLTKVALYENSALTAIGDYAFSSCSNLNEIVLPAGLKKIGSSTFRSCSLKEIVIPLSVTEIGNYSFGNNSKLTIYCEAASKPDKWDENWSGGAKVQWGYTGSEQ